MNLLECDKEKQVLEAVRSGRSASEWEEPLRAHVASCRICSDAALVAQFLLQENECAAAEAQLPDAGLVWWKAQLLARRAAAEHAVRPIAVTEKLAGAGVVALLLTGIVLNWSSVMNWSYVQGGIRWLAGLVPQSASRVPDFFFGLWSLQISLLAATAGGLLFLLALSLYIVCAEE